MTNTNKQNINLDQKTVEELVQLVKGVPVLTEERKKELEPLLDKKITYREVLAVYDIITKPLLRLVSTANRQADMIGLLVADRLDLKDEDWDKAGKQLDEYNKAQQKKLADELLKKTKEVAKENNAEAKRAGIHLVHPKKAITKKNTKEGK